MVDHTAVARPFPLGLLVFLALSGYVASLTAVLVHELLGHGGVAILLGGRVYDIYVSPTSGSANAIAQGTLDDLVIASGTLVAALFGSGVWIWLRARLGHGVGWGGAPLTILLWCVAAYALLDSVTYFAVQPTIAGLTGASVGDWVQLGIRRQVPPAALLSVGLPLVAIVSVVLVRDARRVVTGTLDPEGRFSASAAYGLLTLPSAVLLAGCVVGLAPWSEGPTPWSFLEIFGLPLLGLVGAAWIRFRDGPSSRRPVGAASESSRDPHAAGRSRWSALRPPETHRWSLGLAATGLAAAALFGPTEELRRGIALGPPNPDRYIAVAQDYALELHLEAGSRPTLSIASVARPGRGSPFRQRLTASLAPHGPSGRAALEISRFIARWNLDGSGVSSTTEPAFDGSAWGWDAVLEPLPDSFVVRLWPTTWVTESHVAELRIVGSRGGSPPAEQIDGGLLWRRPGGMSGIDSFSVRR